MSKIYKVRWTSNAKEDLLSIVAYIKEDSPTIAREIYQKIKKKANSNNFLPMRGRVVPELQKKVSQCIENLLVLHGELCIKLITILFT